MLTYGPFPTTQRERNREIIEKYYRDNKTNNKYTTSRDNLAIHTVYQSRVDVQRYKVTEVDMQQGI